MIRWNWRTFLKYLAVQIPGWFLLVGILLLLRSWVDLSFQLIAAFIGFAVLKDLVLYPFLRHAYQGDPRTGGERLIGSRGSVATALTPRGYIFVRGELWEATSRIPDRTLPEGTTVRVHSASGLTLTVEPE